MNSQTSSNTENADSWLPKYEPCPICNGRGWVRYNVPVTDPNFGKMMPCPGDHPSLEGERVERLAELSNLKAFKDKKFDNFSPNWDGLMANERASVEYAYSLATEFAKKPKGWIVFEGDYGTGKTHLAAAIGNSRLEGGDSVLFITVPDLLDHLRSTFAPSADVGYDELFDRVRNIHLLILDDLGSENPSPWAKEKLFQILNHRHSTQLPTIITTNVTMDVLDPRIRSRLLDESLVKRARINAPDYRSPINNNAKQLENSLKIHSDKTFANFDVVTNLDIEQRRNLERMVAAAKDFAVNSQGWLVILGEYGTGKTHVAAATAHARQALGADVLFLTAAELIDHLRSTFETTSTVSFEYRFQEIKNVGMLVLDDVNLKKSSAWAQEKLFQILDYRFVSRLPTVITMHDAMTDVDKRLRTRLLDRSRCVVFALRVPAYYERLR